MISDTSASSARKQKGKATQDKTVELLTKKIPEMVGSISTAKMGAHGEDIIISPEMREQFPYSIECKQDEKGFSRIYKAMAQSRQQVDALAAEIPVQPVAVIQQKDARPLAVMDFEAWAEMTLLATTINSKTEP